MIINIRINTDLKTIRPESPDGTFPEIVEYLLDSFPFDIGKFYGSLIKNTNQKEKIKTVDEFRRAALLESGFSKESDATISFLIEVLKQDSVHHAWSLDDICKLSKMSIVKVCIEIERLRAAGYLKVINGLYHLTANAWSNDDFRSR